MNAQDLRTRAGQLLYRELPEEYRYQDPPPSPEELGDLEAYLHSFGHMLDLIRGTAEQAYADAFAEPVGPERRIQTWLIPYLAELVGAELRAPDPEMRRAELNNAVDWYKSKGTLDAIDEISDVISGAESVVVEGWRRTLATPRMALPPFTAPEEAMGDGDPTEAPAHPLGAPDLRYLNRAINDPTGANPLFRLTRARRDEFGRLRPADPVFWTPWAWRGAPCFAGAYDDTSARTPDLRDPSRGPVGPHPARAIIHLRPPEGLFETGLNGDLKPRTTDVNIDAAKDEQQLFRPVEILAAMGVTNEQLEIDGGPVLPDRLIVRGNLTIPAGTDVVFEDLLFTGTITVDSPDARVEFRRCAVGRISLGHPTEEPALVASDTLFNFISGGVGFAELVYCTVLRTVAVERLHASDCIFTGELIDLVCSGDDTCIRFSRVPDLAALASCGADKAPSNTQHDPNFIRLWFKDGDDCVLRPAKFGEPGAGVLALTSSSAIRAGAEDEGEMGAHHHMFHAAQIRALKIKLEDYLPLGQEVAIRYDAHLSRPPVTTE